jgi:hypothetical protein
MMGRDKVGVKIRGGKRWTAKEWEAVVKSDRRRRREERERGRRAVERMKRISEELWRRM